MAEIDTNEHITTSRERKKRPIASVPKCNNLVECDKNFSVKSSLNKHTSAIHEGKKHSNVIFVITAILKRII